MKRKIWCEVTEEGNLNMMFKYKGTDYGLGVKSEDITPRTVKTLYKSMLITIDSLKEKK